MRSLSLSLVIAACHVAFSLALYDPFAPLFKLHKQVLDASEIPWVDHTVGNRSNNYANSWLGFPVSLPSTESPSLLADTPLLLLTGRFQADQG